MQWCKQDIPDPHCHLDVPLLLKVEPCGPYFLINHKYAVANTYVHRKFDGYVQLTVWGKWPPK